MKIILIGNHPLEKMESMHRYARMLFDGLLGQKVDVSIVRPPVWFAKIKFSAHGVGKWLGYLDKFILFPFELFFKSLCNRHAVFHVCDHSNAMYCHFLPWSRTVVTCHDLLAVRSALGHFKENPVRGSGKLLQKWIMSGLRSADILLCVSQATKEQVLELNITTENKVKTVYFGLNWPYAPMADDRAVEILHPRKDLSDLPAGGFLLHVGGHGWYKNRAGLLRIYFNYIRGGGRLPLVLAGRPMAAALHGLMAECPRGGRVIEVADVSNEELNALYARAACLVFPSLYEGFGWPVLEALTVGCPVVCSRRASLPEVGGDAATYIDPADETEAAKILHQLLDDAEKCQANVQRGLLHASKFSNETMLTQLLELYAMLDTKRSCPRFK